MNKRKVAKGRVVVTYRLPRVLSQNLAAYSVQMGCSQNEVATQAITDFLRLNGSAENVGKDKIIKK